ncbi:MAG: biotin/lipoyl-containing protein [Myxococcota bacterium]|nr:biotin/lipoyl-containing protein [Myxococcota bacterium]
MIVEIRMPEVAADMTEADVVGWLASPGDRITQGDLLFEIETDKSTVEVEAPATGILKEIRVAAGEVGVAVGVVLAVMESDEGAEESPAPPEADPASEPPEVDPTPEPPEVASSPAPPEVDSLDETHASPPPQEEEDRIEKPEPTALARRIAEKAGLDVSDIKGSGARGRVLRADVEESLATESSDSSAQAKENAPEAQDRAPSSEDHFPELIHLSTGCQFDPLIQVTAKLNEAQEEEPISWSAGLIRAIAMAVARLEVAKPALSDRDILSGTRLRVTDGTGSPGALIQGAERMGLGAITTQLASPQAETPTTHGEVGLFHALESGVDRIEAQIRTGQICAFTAGNVSQSPVVENGELVARARVEINLSADPRIFNPEGATLLLGAVRQLLESPLNMVL